MGKALRFLKVLRNNWKKSIFATVALTYGVSYGKETYDTKQLMRDYCLLASKYGDLVHPPTKPVRRITVILNPAANKKKSKDLFDKYCAPLLHLAGLAVTIVQTEYAGQAKDLLNSIDPFTDAIVIAGGDGTVLETVTGLLRRAEGNFDALKKLPIGILPLGQTNIVSQILNNEKVQARALADATMAVIDGSQQTFDIIKIEPIEEDGTNTKPIYSLAQVHWGAFRNAHAKRDKYWYFGRFRQYASYLFSNVQSGTWLCTYTEPCSGCSNCVQEHKQVKRWWNFFTPGKTKSGIDYSKITNEDCGQLLEKKISAVEFCLESRNLSTSEELTKGASLLLSLGPSTLGWKDFVAEGWRRVRGGRAYADEKIVVRELQLTPLSQGESDWLSIDSEEFEVKPVKISVLPRALCLFQPRLSGYV